jgi:hypothetical protein
MTLSLSRFRIRLVLGIALCVFGAVFAIGQAPPLKDISLVYAQGKIVGSEYRNDYFGLTLTPGNAQFTAEAFVSSEGKRARLVDAQADAKNSEDKYEIAVLADLLAANPLIHSPEQYVRAVRHGLEKEGLATISEESPTEISGIHFVYAVMKVTAEGHTHYRGLYTTFLNGYILSLDVAAASPERLMKIVQIAVRLKKQGK